MATAVRSASALVVGGAGALGKAVVQRLARSSKAGGVEWSTTSIDLNISPDAKTNYVLDSATPWSEQVDLIRAEMTKSGETFDAVLHVGGGFAAGGLKAGVAPIEIMFDQNVKSAFTAATLSADFLKPKGLLVLTGSDAAMRGGTGFGIGYGMSKAATHHLAKSIQNHEEMPADARTVCIMPTTLDTVANRSAMPDGDFDTWVAPDTLAMHLVDWSENANNIPDSLFVRFFAGNKDDGPYLASDHIAVIECGEDEDEE